MVRCYDCGQRRADKDIIRINVTTGTYSSYQPSGPNQPYGRGYGRTWTRVSICPRCYKDRQERNRQTLSAMLTVGGILGLIVAIAFAVVVLVLSIGVGSWTLFGGPDGPPTRETRPTIVQPQAMPGLTPPQPQRQDVAPEQPQRVGPPQPVPPGWMPGMPRPEDVPQRRQF